MACSAGTGSRTFDRKSGSRQPRRANMKRQHRLLWGVLGCWLGLGAVPAPGAEGGKPVWLTDYGQARKAARATGRPMFVVFRCAP